MFALTENAENKSPSLTGGGFGKLSSMSALFLDLFFIISLSCTAECILPTCKMCRLL